jgi:DNA-binding CsgD family transcriptional regulator/DNA-binding MarR family transcriptional regulator
MLEEVGIAPEQERTYRALVQLSSARPAEIAEHLGIGEQSATTHLEALVALGLAATSGVEPVFHPLPPDVALGTALVRRQESLEAARRMVAHLTEDYRAGVRRHEADQLVEIIRGRAALRQRLRHLQENAQHEMLWFCRANHVAMASGENVEEFAALRRGVRYQVIYERALLEEPGMIENVAEGIRCGEQARAVPALPVRLAIVDQSIAVCPLVPDGRSGEPTAAVVGRSHLLDALLALFYSYWERASPVALTSPRRASEHSDGQRGSEVSAALEAVDVDSHAVADQPDAQERLLLSLFVAGLPDKAIASQMEVSQRTVQRRLGELMARAGVDTRPGLAFQAARRGWV